MDYVVTAALEPPVQVGELDELQQQGVISVLDQQLSQVEGVTGPANEDIDVLDYRIEVHTTDVTVTLALDAPALPAAEEAAATVLNELLGESRALANWSVSRSEVRITEDEFNQSLAGAETTAETGTPRTESEVQLEAAVEEALEGSQEQLGTESPDTGGWREMLLEMGRRLHAFDESAFGVSETTDREQAGLAAGALIHAVSVVTDEMFYDELALTINDATVGEAVALLVLEELPPCYQHRYDSRFSRALLLSSSVVATRLTEPVWREPRCVAEALALRLFVNEARVVLEAAELMDWERSGAVFAAFGAHAFADTSHDDLFEIDFPLGGEATGSADVSAARSSEVEEALRERGLAFDQWFLQRDSGAADGTVGLHPYTD